KVVNQLLAFFKTKPSAISWFVKTTAAGQGPSVTVTASATSGSDGLKVNFTATATDPGATITQYAWTFNDGGFSLSQNPTNTFLVAGTYDVRLTVSDSLGRTTTKDITITVSGGTSPTRSGGGGSAIVLASSSLSGAP